MPIDPDKYIVFKRDEFFELMGELALPNAMTLAWTGDTPCAPIAGNIIHRASETELPDAVVIRKKDAIASAGLSAYAATAITVSETLQQYQPNQAKHLLEIADFFADAAAEARTIASHLPDF